MQLKIERGNSQYIAHFRIVAVKGRISLVLRYFSKTNSSQVQISVKLQTVSMRVTLTD